MKCDTTFTVCDRVSPRAAWKHVLGVNNVFTAHHHGKYMTSALQGSLPSRSRHYQHQSAHTTLSQSRDLMSGGYGLHQLKDKIRQASVGLRGLITAPHCLRSGDVDLCGRNRATANSAQHTPHRTHTTRDTPDCGHGHAPACRGRVCVSERRRARARRCRIRF